MNLNAGKAARGVTIVALCAALMFAVQVALSGIANVELVSLLIILFTLTLRGRVMFAVYVFVVLEGLLFGFHIWWISYLYVWTVLAGVALLLKRMESAVGWAVVSGSFGLSFGALCAVPYLFMGGLPMAVSYWVGGIPFDLVHCVSNFVLCLVLFKPLKTLLDKYVTVWYNM